jgi:hypothetical protein
MGLINLLLPLHMVCFHPLALDLSNLMFPFKIVREVVPMHFHDVC